MTPPAQPIFRFAPSPNGKLHLGHAYSALFTSYWAQKSNGKLLLRIEDTDITRSRPAYVQAILDDLSWLGLVWEEPIWHQSTRFDEYEAAANRLKDMGLIYPCFCSRKEVAEAATHKDPDGAPLYPGTCKHLTAQQIAEKQVERPTQNWRLNVSTATEMTGPLSYSVARPSPLDRPKIQYARPQIWGDVVVQRLGTPTSYHLSVVVDDYAQNITHVTRGRDMEAATDIHVLLQFLLGFTSPIYTHHKLLLDSDDTKLSKSKKSASLESMREEGWTAQAVRAHLGFE